MLGKYSKIAAAGSLAVLLSACSPEHPEQADAAQNSHASTLLVCSQGSYTPFQFRDQNGAITGYDADVLKAVCKHQGCRPTFVIRRWEDLLPALNRKECDLAAAALTLTDERKRDYAVSQPYGRTSSVILYAHPPLNPRTIDDLQGVEVAVNAGSYAEPYLRRHGIQKLTTRPSAYLSLKAAVSGEVQAAAGNIEVLSYYLNQDPQIDVLITDGGVLSYFLKDKPAVQYRTLNLLLPEDQNGIGFVMRKNDSALKTKIDAGLAQIAADGTLANLQRKWLGGIQKLPSTQ